MDAHGSAIPLSHLQGHRIANGSLDPRGWDVCSAEGRWIGVVNEVLVDTRTRQVRYLDVEVETLIVTGRERHVLIPVEHARRTPAPRRAVVLPGLAAREVVGLPSYTRGAAVREGDPAITPPLCAEPNTAHEPLDLPIRVEPPLVLRPIGLPPQPRREPAGESAVAQPAKDVPGKHAARSVPADTGSRAA